MLRQKLLTIVILLGASLTSIGQPCPSNDLDCDGISDALEKALAERFAPQWRFHRDQPNEGSQQDKNEIIYPTSVHQWLEDVVDQEGQYPIVEVLEDGVVIDEVEIQDMDDLADETMGFFEDGYSMRINNYPTQMNGDPDDFPTYFRCDTIGAGRVHICYILFYPYDDKRVEIPPFGNDYDGADHRGDWSGINIKVSNVDDYSSVGSASDASIDTVWYGGHGTKRFISCQSPDYYNSGDHPRVYVSSGSHTCFPRPGEWHNFDVTGFWGYFPFVDNFDDMFAGDGLVVDSWSPNRELINMGDRDDDGDFHPLVGWLEYRGFWGPDGSGENGSPKGPWSKGEWFGDLDEAEVWEDLVDDNISYNTDFTPTNTPVGDGWFSEGNPSAVFFGDDRWQGSPLVQLGPGAYNDGLYWGSIFSILHLGNVDVIVYSNTNFTGIPVELSRSSPQVPFLPRSFIIAPHNMDPLGCDMVADSQYGGGETGSWSTPYDTASEAVDEVQEGGHVCLKAGDYEQNLLITKKLTMHSYFGSSKIGE